MTREYTRRPDLYDVEHGGDTLPGEIDFYRRLAQESGGPVLELGFGTGRVGLELARSGIEVVGLDRSTAMLARARQKLLQEPPEVSARLTLVEASMADFQLEQRFALIYVPFRAFLHLHAEEEQRAALRCIRAHLATRGRFAGNFFRPKPSFLQTFAEDRLESVVTSPDGRSVLRSSRSPRCDTHRQIKEIIFHTRVYAPDGALEEDRIDFLELAWIYAREWKLMLELEGLTLEQLYGGFQGQPPGGENWEYVWVAQAR